MQEKRLDQYTKKEKTNLINHWFHYYGKEIYTLEELEQLQKLIEKNDTKIFEMAIINYINGEGPSLLLKAIRQNRVEEILEQFHQKSKEIKSKYPDEYETTAKAFIKEIVGTYNHKTPDIPLSEGELLRQLQELTKNKGYLTDKNVNQIFNDCLFKEEELQDGKPTKDFSFAIGVATAIVFNTERLNEHKSEINNMINELYGIETGTTFTNLCIKKDGTQWTSLHRTMDKLMILGFATGPLEIPCNIPREEWANTFENGLPIVVKNEENIATPVVGISKEDYDKITKRYRKK